MQTNINQNKQYKKPKEMKYVSIKNCSLNWSFEAIILSYLLVLVDGAVIHRAANTEYTEFPTAQDVADDTLKSSLFENDSIFRNCHKFEDGEFQNICRKIASNPIIASMNNYTSGDTDPESKKGTLNSICKATQPNLSRTCPDYSINGPRIGAPSNLLSLSPWEYCENTDENRFPKLLNEAKCLCTGCIDPNTGRETHDYVSLPVKVKIPIIKKSDPHLRFHQCRKGTCYESIVEITVGCHCGIPVNIFDMMMLKR